MKIGACIVLKDMATLENQFKTLKENGFTVCQFISWNPTHWTDENAEIIKDYVKKYGITITAFWCGWTGPCYWNFYEGQISLGLVPEAYRSERIKELCAGADFAKKLGVTDVITHMGYIPENPYDPNFAPFCLAVKMVARHLENSGQYLLFETGQETPTTMLRCFEQIGMDNLGVNLDTGNLVLYGKGNPVDALDVFGKYVRNIHAKDGFFPTDGRHLGREARVGDGRVDFRLFFERLKEIGYDTYVIIEREISGEQQLKDVVYAKEYLSKLVSEIYGG